MSLSRVERLKLYLDPMDEDDEGKKDLFKYILYSVFARFLPIMIPTKHILVTGQVLSDGRGDYFHIKKTAEKIKNLFPTYQVYMVAELEELTVNIGYFESAEKEIETFLLLPGIHDNERALLKENCHKYDLIINTPSLYYPTFILNSEKQQEHAVHQLDNSIRLAEYGIRDFHNQIPLGLSCDSLGIILEEDQKNYKIENIESGFLKTLLIEDQSIEEFLATNNLYFGYFRQGVTPEWENFLFQFWNAYSTKDKIVIVLNFKNKIDLIQVEKNCSRKVALKIFTAPFFAYFNAKRIEVYLKNKSYFEELDSIDSGGMHSLKIIDPFPLSHNDFLTMIQKSDLPTAVMGDQSFGEAVSFYKLPFYQPLAHKQSFIYELREYLEDYFPNSHQLIKLFYECIYNFKYKRMSSDLEISKLAKSMGAQFKKEENREDLHSFLHHIHEEYSFVDIIGGVVSEFLLSRAEVQYNNLKQDIFNEYISGNLSESNVEELISEYLLQSK
ncbi:MAG: hypothetical protein WDZ28_05375 [Simkaniaceae bacterium]